MSFRQWLGDLFKDERGSTSIKPVATFLCTIFLCVTMLVNSFLKEEFKPADNLVNAVMILAAIGMGADTADKFSSIKKKTQEMSE